MRNIMILAAIMVGLGTIMAQMADKMTATPALARPQTGRAESELPAQGIDIAHVLDTSSSMTTSSLGQDTRLAVAQRVLTDFVKGRTNDRIGLVIFREDSLVLSPLTLDYDALSRLLGDVSQVNLSDGTAIGAVGGVLGRVTPSSNWKYWLTREILGPPA